MLCLFSWKQASWMCKHIGGTLPVFRSRDELNQLLSFLKFSPVLPILEAFFIGLFQGLCAQNRLKKCGDISQKSFIWETREPMVFQKWREVFQLSRITVSSLDLVDYEMEPHTNSPDRYVRSIIESKNYVHPHIFKECVAMIVHNLVDPIWVSTNCKDRWVSDTFCMVRVIQTIPFQLQNATYICETPKLKTTDLCLEIVWSLPNELKDKCKSLQQTIGGNVSAFQYVFEATSVTFPPVLLHDYKKTKSLIFLSTGNIVQFHVKIITTLPDQFISLKTTPLQIVTSYGNIFHCKQNVSISFSLVCDGNKDCPGEEPSDESNCPSSNGSLSCPAWYHLHGMECLLPFTLRPPHITKLLMRTTAQNCSSHKLLSCTEGCFDFTDICIFKHHSYNIIPCKRGEHIQSCKQFQCNTKFKCPGFYCIPWNYTCDGIWDCPDGTDESETNLCYNNRLCHGAFKCQRTHLCIHLADTCNGKSDCAFGDDELFCSLSRHMCPIICSSVLQHDNSNGYDVTGAAL